MKIFIKKSFIITFIILNVLFVFNTSKIYAAGEFCYENSDCNETAREVCDRTEEQRLENQPGECAINLDDTCADDSDCGDDSICQTGRCMTGSRDSIGHNREGESCSGNQDCQSGLACVDSVCTNTVRGSGGGGVAINNPLSSDTIPELIATIMSTVIGLIGILAVAAFVYGGVLYLTSGGSEEQSGKAKKVLGYAVMGLIVSILS